MDDEEQQPTRMGGMTRAMAHLARRVCQRVMRTGIRCCHFGPISFMA